MPFFEITLNEELRVIVGGDDLDILTFGVISVQGASTAYLQVSSMNKIAEENEILFSRHLGRGEYLVAKFKRTGIQKIPQKGALYVDTRRRLAGRVGFAVNLNSAGHVSASVDDDSMLHVAVNWLKSKNQCLFEMACIRMTSDGQNQMLLEHEIMEGQAVGIQIV